MPARSARSPALTLAFLSSQSNCPAPPIVSTRRNCGCAMVRCSLQRLSILRAMARDVLIVTDERMRMHSAGAGHPEQPARLEAIEADLRRDSIAGVRFDSPQPSPREAILRVHDAQYVDFIDSLRG